MVERRTGNRFTGASVLTDREARRVSKMILALQSIAEKENRFVKERLELEFASRILFDIVENAGRDYVLAELQVERSAFKP